MSKRTRRPRAHAPYRTVEETAAEWNRRHGTRLETKAVAMILQRAERKLSDRLAEIGFTQGGNQ